MSCKKEAEKQEKKEDRFVKTKTKPSAIDSLQTNEQIERFIAKTDTMYRKFTLKKVQDIGRPGCDSLLFNLAERYHIKSSFEKADFDNNGYTDLLVTGENKTYTDYDYTKNIWPSKEFNAVVLMNFGSGNVKLYDLTDGGIVPKVEYVGQLPLLVVHKPIRIRNERTKSDEKIAKLTFKYGDFTEYNPKPVYYHIEKIKYRVTPCFGQCVAFTMEIGEEKKATFDAVSYNYTRDWYKSTLLSGSYKGTINDTDFYELLELTQYIDFPNLKNSYHVMATDSSTGELTITYNGGQEKRIGFYYLQGTYGLYSIQKKIFDLRHTQNWKKVSDIPKI
jgi:hypothetical protein